MPQVRLAISGLSECLEVVKPVVGQIVAAFAPLGIDLIPQTGIVLPKDPENQVDGWYNLTQQLETLSKKSSPIHLVVTQAPPNHEGDIDGSLLDPSVRGVAAVYLGAYVYGTGGAGSRPDLLAQICVHELGHLFNLAHEDGLPTPQGASYSNVIQPSSSRLTQSVAQAWSDATSEAQAAGEPPYAPPTPAWCYPFNRACRTHLRAAAAHPGWLPFHGSFRGDPNQAGATHDTGLDMCIHPHDRKRRAVVGGGLYFTLEIRNPTAFPVEIPLHIAPDHGSLHVMVESEDGVLDTYRPARLDCSRARAVILPRQKCRRSLVLLGSSANPLFKHPGRHRCRLLLLDPHRPDRSALTSATVDLTVQNEMDAREPVTFLLNVIDRKRPRRHEMARASQYSATAFHAALLRAQRIRSSAKRVSALEWCLDRRAPAAIRHRAARQIAIEHLRADGDWRKIQNRFRRLFSGPLHEELHTALRQTRDGWRTQQDSD